MAIQNFSAYFMDQHLRIVEKDLTLVDVEWLAGQVFPLEYLPTDPHPNVCLFLTSSQMAAVQNYIQTNSEKIISDQGNFTYNSPIAWVIVWLKERHYEIIQDAAGFYGNMESAGHIDQLGNSEGTHTYIKGPDTKVTFWISPTFEDEETKGIDVSYYQGKIDWKTVASEGVTFAFAQATQGASFQDPTFADNWHEMKEVNILRGAYHSFNSGQSGAEQAELFLKMLKQNGLGELPPALMVDEDKTKKATFLSEVHQWLETVEQELKQKPIICTYTSFWNTLNADALQDYPLWVASYEPPPIELPNGWKHWTYWQHSSSGSLKGITGDVNLDYYNGFLSELKSQGNETEPTKTAPSSATSKASSESTTEASSSSASSSTIYNEPAKVHHNQGPREYTVQEGDTLASIGKQFGVDPHSIVQANHISKQDMIYVGQKLVIPPPEKEFSQKDP